MRCFLLLVVAMAATASAARAERMTVAVSTPEVMINSNFTGAPVTVFGVIERDSGAPVMPGGSYQVAILIVGPNETVVERRKDRLLGVWVNRASRAISQAPSLYVLNASHDLAGIANPSVLERLQIGFDNIGFVFDGRAPRLDPESGEFRDAFIRLKQQAGLYSEKADVSFIGDLIFRGTSFLPANLPVGHYTVLAYLFSGGELIAHAQDKIDVSKTGFEGSMAAFARNQSLLYGLICASLAVFIGWAGGVIFRRD